jgi:hypothetical protein
MPAEAIDASAVFSKRNVAAKGHVYDVSIPGMRQGCEKFPGWRKRGIEHPLRGERKIHAQIIRQPPACESGTLKRPLDTGRLMT